MDQREFARLMGDTFRRLDTETLIDDSAEEAWATAATDLERVGRWLRDGSSPRPVSDLVEDVIESLFEVRFHFDHDPDEVQAGGAVAKPDFVARVFADEIMAPWRAGQQEYAGAGRDAFANFQRIGAELGLDKKVVLWVYAMKHRDGVQSYFNGHRSQREDVRGRLNDLIVYLFLLYGMLADEEGEASERAGERETALREALSALRYIEQRYGRLDGVGWDRVLASPPSPEPADPDGEVYWT